jgi:acyl carrier protein
MTAEKLKKIIANQLGIEPNSISLENKIVDDLGTDSLDIVEIVMDVENAFSIKIEDEEYQDADTVQKIVDLINTKIEKK